jgi:ATPase family protein associated with various cellular activities (AAA)
MSNEEPSERPPELADVGRLARRLVGRAVQTARTEDQPLRRLLLDHLGPDAAALPTASASWPAYEHVNVQVGLEAWLDEGTRTHEVFGITGTGFMRHMEIVGIGDLLQPRGDGPFGSASYGGVMTVAVPSGPDGRTHPCVSHGIYLVEDDGIPLVIVLQPVDRGPFPQVVLQITGQDQGRIQAVLGQIQTLTSERSVFRGQVISFGPEVFGPGRQVPMNFLERPSVGRDQIVLPADVLDNIERQVLGVGRLSGRLLASGQHLKRGVLLHGAPGTGKTHTVGYLLGQMPEATVIVISGRALGRIREACSVARSLQPSIIVVEDVDLIAEQREARPGEHPLLFQLLNEMDGLNSGTDVTFLLTTNRADLLEPALANRPGRVDLAAELPLPDADARRQLIRLYQGNLVLDLASPETVIERTEGVTAAFLKELLRQAALLSAEQDDTDGPIHVTDAHLDAALDQLLDTRNQLTRVLLGGEPPRPKASKAAKPLKPPKAPKA